LEVTNDGRKTMERRSLVRWGAKFTVDLVTASIFRIRREVKAWNPNRPMAREREQQMCGVWTMTEG